MCESAASVASSGVCLHVNRSVAVSSVPAGPCVLPAPGKPEQCLGPGTRPRLQHWLGIPLHVLLFQLDALPLQRTYVCVLVRVRARVPACKRVRLHVLICVHWGVHLHMFVRVCVRMCATRQEARGGKSGRHRLLGPATLGQQTTPHTTGRLGSLLQNA